jgi:peptidylprolyl isomerase
MSTLAPVLTACSNNNQTTNDAGSNPDSSATDASVGEDADAGLYLPAGYTLMPFLTDSATTHTYTAAQQVIDQTHDYVAVLDTDVGRIVLHLLSQVAPITVNSFVFLTLNHFYDGVLFHRVIPGFVAQAGDPNTISGAQSTWGTGGCGYEYALEVNAAYNYDDAGIVGAARTSDPNSNGSQFFITLAAVPSLDQMYTIWADVIEGLDVLPNIAPDADPQNEIPPTNPTRIQDVYIGVK